MLNWERVGLMVFFFIPTLWQGQNWNQHLLKTCGTAVKRNIVASIIGIAASVASVASSYGQGQVLFKNYGYTTFAPVQYAGGWVPAGKENQYVGAPFHAELLYQFGPFGVRNAGVFTPFFSVDSPDQAIGSGFFNGGAVNFADYTSGPVTFTVRAYNGADYHSSLCTGSTTFTMSSISTGITLPIEFGNAMSGFRVTCAPEPSTFVLIGLGAGALLLFRRLRRC